MTIKIVSKSWMILISTHMLGGHIVLCNIFKEETFS